MTPLVDKVAYQRQEIYSLTSSLTQVQNSVKELEYAVFRKHSKLTIFENIYQKIAANDVLRSQNDSKLLNMIGELEFKMKEMEFGFENMKKQMIKLHENKDFVDKQFQTLKVHVDEIQEDFMNQIQKSFAEMTKYQNEIRVQMQKIDYTVSVLENKNDSNNNLMNEIMHKNKSITSNIDKCMKEFKTIQILKNDKVTTD